jgi:hypothetical protein
VYKYVRKNSQGIWNENDMEKAIQETALGTLKSVACSTVFFMQRCTDM